MRQRVSVFVFVRQMFRGYACVCVYHVCLSVYLCALCILFVYECVCVCVAMCVIKEVTGKSRCRGDDNDDDYTR